jgi:aconitate hydratase
MNKQDFTTTVTINQQACTLFDINKLEENKIADISRLPFSIKILVENLLRKLDGRVVKEEDLKAIANWQKRYVSPVEIPFHPSRVLMQDFTGVPAVVDLAAMRDAVKNLGGDPQKINPLVPVELVVDHSIQIDHFGNEDCLKKNVELEYQRNNERYKLLKWAQKSFDNFNVVPPNSGICHQVNLEYLGRVTSTEKSSDTLIAYPDTVVGTDSHTTMINGIGVMGWGVGGIEAEAVMLGQPYYMSIPEVIGVKLIGELKKGVTATDLVLTITELLRQYNVVERFVEYFGPGTKNLNIPDRATIANMTPEYGATLGFFPVDEKTLEYLELTNRKEQAKITSLYTKATGLFSTDTQTPDYTKVIELDLAGVEPSLAGPARPQDRISLKNLKQSFSEILGCEYDREADIKEISNFFEESGHKASRSPHCKPVGKRSFTIQLKERQFQLSDGSVVIAAITSCTNTSNPYVLIGAGLIAKKAVEKGLHVSPLVKTSLTPGSKIVLSYLEDAGLMSYFKDLGFHIAAFGCATCIGNSGPLHTEVEKVILENDLNVAGVLSGNRNFEARIHPNIKSNFLASPMLVMAFALAGRVDIDLTVEPVGTAPNGDPVYLNELWPDPTTISKLMQRHVKKDFFKKEYGRIFDGDEFWEALHAAESTTYAWDNTSTYIKNPPYFEDIKLQLQKPTDVKNARNLLLLGDSVTTDHISPAGAIPKDYPAGKYLIKNDVVPEDFNSYGARRGNHEVMMRGTFGNIRIKNQMVAPKEGSFTMKFPQNEKMFNYNAAMIYKNENTPLIVLAGREYGTGSSRDWAAKGSHLLGIKAIIAESYERIHRNNLIGMGILPLVFKKNESIKSLGLDGSETYTINGIENITPRKVLSIKAISEDRSEKRFEVISRLDTEVDVEYFENGGILPCVLRKMMDR